MSIPDAYSLKTHSISKYFQALLTLPVPEVFDAVFFSDIGFRYAIDRSFIDILKELHFLDADGRPTRRYFDFHDGIAASDALLDGIREAYGRLLEADPDACGQPQKRIFETLKTLYAGSKPDMMVLGIAKTFVALCQYAEEIDRNPPPLHAAMEVRAKDAGQGEPEATPEPADTAAPEPMSETPTPQPEPTPVPQNPTLAAAPTDAGGLAGDIQESFVLPPLVLDEDTPPRVQAREAVEDAGTPGDDMASGPAPEPATQAPQSVDPIVTAEPDPVRAAAKRLSIRSKSDVDGQPHTVNFVLPETRDPAVYEAIFASFKRQLLKPE
ncbi:MAG: DUF5343 domain-containing protein [Desulfovibrio sp.]